jgi:hypothetical protein
MNTDTKILNKILANWYWWNGSRVEFLPSKCYALSSNPVLTKKIFNNGKLNSTYQKDHTP